MYIVHMALHICCILTYIVHMVMHIGICNALEVHIGEYTAYRMHVNKMFLGELASLYQGSI